jgi:hypothetical protein
MAIISPPGSLSKEFPHQAIDQTIRAARGGMTMTELKRVAPNPDLGPVVCARWLQLQNDRVVRDRFLSLAEAEGLESARMRKIMYGVFALRDKRIREFVTRRITTRAGLWQPAEVVRKSNSNHFQGASRAKVRSNFEFFLVNAGIYDKGAVHLELEDGWLQDAVAIASQYEDDPETRTIMLADPIGYIINEKLHGLANATVDQLRGAPPIAQPEADFGEDAEIDQAAPIIPGAPAGHAWNRQAPQFRDRQAAAVFNNAVARERASAAHYSIEQLLVAAARAAGRDPQTTVNIDVYFAVSGGTLMAEVKSCHVRNIHSQTRRGISQLLEYEHLFGDRVGRPVTKMLVLEMQPSGKRTWLVNYLTGLGIFVCWRSRDGSRLQSTVAIPSALAGIIHAA